MRDIEVIDSETLMTRAVIAQMRRRAPNEPVEP
jgi:hypothetical protein